MSQPDPMPRITWLILLLAALSLGLLGASIERLFQAGFPVGDWLIWGLTAVGLIGLVGIVALNRAHLQWRMLGWSEWGLLLLGALVFFSIFRPWQEAGPRLVSLPIPASKFVGGTRALSPGQIVEVGMSTPTGPAIIKQKLQIAALYGDGATIDTVLVAGDAASIARVQAALANEKTIFTYQILPESDLPEVTPDATSLATTTTLPPTSTPEVTPSAIATTPSSEITPSTTP